MVEPALRVILVKRRGLGMGADEYEVPWPAGWRLPLVGESVTFATTGGFVETLNWAPDEGVLRIYLR